MRVLPHLLAQFAPELQRLTPEVLAEYLTNLGFETEILAGETPALEVSITPNRADGMSHLGLARDLRAYLDRDSKKPKKTVRLDWQQQLDDVEDAAAPAIIIKPTSIAPQYDFILFDHITVAPSPDWLQQELTLLGIRPINTVVDVTNYLMELSGQPLHAFDADLLDENQLLVRLSRIDETVTTLDGTTHTLPDGVIVIESNGTLVDLAGLQGGANSEISPSTTRVLLQSALFERSRIRHAIGALKHRTAAATRYERGVDPEVSLAVLSRAVELLTSNEFGSARVVGKHISKRSTHQSVVTVDPVHVDHLLGLKTASARQAQLLTLLGCTVESTKKQLQVTPPSWRFDLGIWQDAVEEIARLQGLNDVVPLTPLPDSTAVTGTSELEWAESVKDQLASIGLSEVQTYTFVSKKDIERFHLKPAGELANPLNPELQYIRPSLLPNLAHVIASNGLFDPITIFEIGHIFHPDGETVSVGIGLAGTTLKTEAWIARIADSLGIDSATLTKHLHVEELSDDLKRAYKIRKSRATLMELPLEALKQAKKVTGSYRVTNTPTKYRSISKFPPVVRDVALLVDEHVKASTIRLHIQSLDPRVEAVELFDEFSSPKLGEGKKSLAFHIYYADLEKTMTDEEAAKVHDFVIDSTTTTFRATVR